MAETHTRSGWIDKPAFVKVTLSNGTTITGRAAAYSDPLHADYYGAFQYVDREGVSTFVLWAAIAHLTVFPLSTEPPDEA